MSFHGAVVFSYLADNKTEKLDRLILEEDYPRDKIRHTSRSFQVFIQKCLEKDPEKRVSLSELLREGWLTEGK